MTIDCGYIFEAEPASATIYSAPLDLSRVLYIIGTSYSWTGDVNMDFHWEGRNTEDDEWATAKDPTGATVAFAESAAGTPSNAAQTFKDIGLRFCRVKGSHNSGNGTVTMFANTKVQQ
jgi:hypothetical protein